MCRPYSITQRPCRLFVNFCNSVERDTKNRGTILSVTTNRWMHSLKKACLATDFTTWLELFRHLTTNPAHRLTSSILKCNRPQSGATSTEWVRAGRPQTRFSPLRHAMQTRVVHGLIGLGWVGNGSKIFVFSGIGLGHGSEMADVRKINVVYICNFVSSICWQMRFFCGNLQFGASLHHLVWNITAVQLLFDVWGFGWACLGLGHGSISSPGGGLGLVGSVCLWVGLGRGLWKWTHGLWCRHLQVSTTDEWTKSHSTLP